MARWRPITGDEPYHESIRRLARLPGADPERFLAVRTGEELTAERFTGATAAGMTAVLLCDPAERDIVLARPDGRDWRGLRIATLPEVLAILDAA